MITLPVVLIAVAVLLLLALLLGLFLQRRRTARATLPGPRTVADLVQQRADREPAPAPDVDEPAPVETVSPAEVASPVDETSTVETSTETPVVVDDVDAHAAEVDEPVAPTPEPAPVLAARAIAPLGDDVPWRRAAQMSGTDDPEPDPAPAEVGRVPALALLRRPSRRPQSADTRHPFLASSPRLAAVPAERPEAGAEGTSVEPVDVEPGGVVEGETAGERVGPAATDSESTAAEPPAAEPVGAEPADVALADGEPAGVESGGVEPASAATAGQAAAEMEDVVPADAGTVDAEQTGSERDDRSVLPLAMAGLAAGGVVAAGARAAVGPTGDGEIPAAEHPDRGDAEASPAPDPGAAGAATSAGAVTLVAATPGSDAIEPDAFPSTDPDLLFDSPADEEERTPEVPAPAPGAPADTVAAAHPPVVDAPAGETVEPEAADGPAAPGASGAGGSTTEVPAPEAPVADAPLAADPTDAASDAVAPAGDAADAPAAATVEPLRRVPRDPEHVAAEQAAADLALLRTFGDPSARPERAPIVALEGTARPESPPPVGAAQPVRYRTVRRDGTEVSGAAVALLDDHGREVGAGRSATGGLTAPHPGAYVLVATAPDHQPGAVALAVGDAPVDVEVLLVRSAALVGVVTGEDGPLAGARVTLVQDGEVVDVAETDADGAYLVADLASGEYAVSVASAGCEADVVLVVVPDETECVHDVELEPAGVPAG